MQMSARIHKIEHPHLIGTTAIRFGDYRIQVGPYDIDPKVTIIFVDAANIPHENVRIWFGQELVKEQTCQ